MNTSDIIKEIERLPLSKRIYVIERAIQSIRKNEDLHQMEEAVNALLPDYRSDYELTAFTTVDMDEFYET